MNQNGQTMMLQKPLTFTRRYWRWYPLWLILGMGLLSILATVPFSPYHLYPVQTFADALWTGLFEVLRHPESLLVLAILFAAMLFTAPSGAPSRGIVLGYVLFGIIFFCGLTLLGPALGRLSLDQPPRVIAEGEAHDYYVDSYLSGSDGVFYTVHECDTRRILCRELAEVRGVHATGYLYTTSQVDIALVPTETGVQLVEQGEVIYTYP